MKASEVIKRLRELKQLHGDKEVSMTSEWGNVPVLLIAAYDEDGRGKDDPGFKKISQFHVH